MSSDDYLDHNNFEENHLDDDQLDEPIFEESKHSYTTSRPNPVYDISDVDEPEIDFQQLITDDLDENAMERILSEEELDLALSLQMIVDNNPRSGNNSYRQNDTRPSQSVGSINFSNRRPQRPNQNDESNEKCVVCWENNADVVFSPCAHKCCCSKDALNVLNNFGNCPICRTSITGIIRTN